MELIIEHFQEILLAIVVMSFIFVAYLEAAEHLREERMRPTKYNTLEFVTHQEKSIQLLWNEIAGFSLKLKCTARFGISTAKRFSSMN